MPIPEITPPDFAGSVAAYRQTRAKTDIMETEAAKAKQDFATSQEFQQKVRQISPSLPIIDRLDQIADAATSAGRFSDAEKVLGMMSQISSRAALDEQRKAMAADHREKVEKAEYDRQMQLMSGAASSDDWRAAGEIFKQEFGRESPIFKLPYSPRMVEVAKNALTKQRSATQEALDKARTVLAYADAARAAKQGDAMARYYDARAEYTRNREGATGKSGGKVATASSNDVKEVSAKIRNLYPALPAKELDAASRELAADAKDIQLREHGSYADAVDKALKARAGQFSRVAGSPGVFGIGATKAKEKYSSLPAGIPKGSKVIGKTPAGKDVWKSPEGKQYVESDDKDEEEE